MAPQTQNRSLAANPVSDAAAMRCGAVGPMMMPFASMYQLAYEAARRTVEAQRIRDLNRRFGYSLN